MTSKVGIHFYDSVLSRHVLPMQQCSFYIKTPFFFFHFTNRRTNCEKKYYLNSESPLSGEQRAGLGASSSLACGLPSDFGHIASPLMPQFPHLANGLRSPDEDLDISV